MKLRLVFAGLASIAVAQVDPVKTNKKGSTLKLSVE